MKILPLLFLFLIVIILTPAVQAVSVAEQTTDYSASLNVWQVVQELGTNLSGTAEKFTFRVSTSVSNKNQFDFTAANSRIYDKDNNNSYILGCTPAESSADPLAGLIFSTQGVPTGYQDVTIDFSCQKYSFISGHRYLIFISNANIPQFGGLIILFAAAAYGGTTTDHFTDGGLRYANGNFFEILNNGGRCNPVTYIWNDQTLTPQSGCNIKTTPKDDLYFILTNTSPPPKTPVIFIPGIGGSEFKAGQDIIWADQDDGHGGKFSHAYTGGEKIWVNQGKAAELGEDDYFDVLRLKSDGVTSEASLSLTGDLTSFGYADIDSFFTGLGYGKGKNFFVFPYDWRKDVKSTKDSLDVLVEEAKTKSSQTKVNIVAHSMGGLVARYYISDSGKAAKVNKLIELGVPHLGAVEDIKALVYGLPLGKPVLKFLNVGIAGSEVRDVFQNLPSAFQLLPSKYFYNFYDNSNADQPFPFRDDRDIDDNQVVGYLNFDQIKTLLGNLGHNMTVFPFGEQLHNLIQPLFNNSNGAKLYNIVGSNQPTLGQIRETWLITWPINLIPIRDEFYVNGDGTVPLYSASLKSSAKDFSAGATIYYTEQEHVDLVRKDGVAMQTVKSILEEEALPVEVKTEKIDLEGQHLSVDQDGELDLFDEDGKHTGLKSDGEIETNISETFYSTSDKTKHAFVKKKAKKVKAKISTKKKDKIKTNVRLRHHQKDKVAKTAFYKDISLKDTSKVELTIDPAVDISPSITVDDQIISPTAEVSGTSASDQTPPSTKIDVSGTKDSSGKFISNAKVTLTGSDSESGVLKTEFSLDNGQTVQTFTSPFIISTPGKTTLQVKSIDKLGNEEIPKEITIEIAQSSSSLSNSSSSKSSLIENTSEVKSSNTSEVEKSQAVLGISFKNPAEIATSAILVTQTINYEPPTPNRKSHIILGGLLMALGGITGLFTLGLLFTFLKPPPK